MVQDSKEPLKIVGPTEWPSYQYSTHSNTLCHRHFSSLPISNNMKYFCKINKGFVGKILKNILQDAQLSQRDSAAGCVIVFAKSRRMELGDNILRTV